MRCVSELLCFRTSKSIFLKAETRMTASIGHENNVAQPKANKRPSSTSHFSLFNCLSVVLWLDKGDHPENWHVVFPPDKYRSF